MKLLSLLIKGLIRGYQLTISPWLPPSCRYYPSCSSYGIEAVERHGPLRGGWLTLRRLLRCHPWGGEGFDPVPEKTKQESHSRVWPFFSAGPRSPLISREQPE